MTVFIKAIRRLRIGPRVIEIARNQGVLLTRGRFMSQSIDPASRKISVVTLQPQSNPSAPHPSAAGPRSSIGWYVHLPFCTTKCGYCDFYSLPTIPGLIDRLVAALRAEARLRDPGRPVETIFIGGGTPTVLPAPALDEILTNVVAHTGPVGEFTVEANPSSTDELKLDLLRRRGVNRISFGAQSFHADELAILERIHDPAHISESVRAARSAGFENINLDLIYAIPGQTIERWRDNLRRAIDLRTEHLSCYSLMFEPGTALTRLRQQGRIAPVDEELEADLFELTIDELAAAGFEHYEISNFARPGRRCRANIIYWENREYLGIGPSAVSFLDGLRTKNVADVRRYVDHFAPSEPGAADLTTPLALAPQSPVVESERLDPHAHAAETAVQWLRLTEGIDCAKYLDRIGLDPRRHFAAAIDQCGPVGLLEVAPDRIRLTRRGMLVANRVMGAFLEVAGPSARGSCAAACQPTLPRENSAAGD